MLHDEYGKGVESSKLGLLPGYYRVAILLAGFISKHTQHKIVYSADVEVSALWMKIRRTVVAIQETVENQRTVRSREQALEEIQQIVELSSPGDETPFGYTKLNDDDRTRIFSAIEKIRQEVEQSALSKRKKDAILKKLSELHQEVARPATRTERIFGFLSDLAFVAGEMAKRGKPAIEEAKEMARIVMHRRSEQEGVELPGPEELPQLPAPTPKA